MLNQLPLAENYSVYYEIIVNQQVALCIKIVFFALSSDFFARKLL